MTIKKDMPPGQHNAPAQFGGTTRLAGETVTVRRIEVSDMMGESDQVILVHNGTEYRLRVTAANKLILNK